MQSNLNSTECYLLVQDWNGQMRTVTPIHAKLCESREFFSDAKRSICRWRQYNYLQTLIGPPGFLLSECNYYYRPTWWHKFGENFVFWCRFGVQLILFLVLFHSLFSFLLFWFFSPSLLLLLLWSLVLHYYSFTTIMIKVARMFSASEATWRFPNRIYRRRKNQIKSTIRLR